MIKIIFFGTPDYVIPVLEKLHKNFKLVGVVTQPPKEAGRQKTLSFSPVDHWAHKHKDIKILRDLDIKNFPEANLGIVASYGKIIPQSVIDFFPNGILNIHPSILPKYRGAAPVQATILNGDTVTGVSVIKMDSKMDHGPIVSVLKEQIEDTDTNESLRNRLFEKSAQFLIDLIPFYLSDKITLKKQNDEDATFTKIMTREDGLVNLEKDKPEVIDRKLRALKPWPGVWSYIEIDNTKKRLKILKAHIEDNKLVLDKVQLEGKKPVSFEEFKRGYPDMQWLES